jgi:hypothetical protein
MADQLRKFHSPDKGDGHSATEHAVPKTEHADLEAVKQLAMPQADETEMQKNARYASIVDQIEGVILTDHAKAQEMVNAVRDVLGVESSDFEQFGVVLGSRFKVEKIPPAAPVTPEPIPAHAPTRMPTAMSGRVTVEGKKVDYRVLEDGSAELMRPGKAYADQIAEGGFIEDENRSGAVVWQDGVFKRLNKAGLQAHRESLKSPDRAARKLVERTKKNERFEKKDSSLSNAYTIFLEGLVDGKQVGTSFEAVALEMRPETRAQLAEMIEKKRGVPRGTLEGVMRTLELQDKKLGRDWAADNAKNKVERTKAVEKAHATFETLHFNRDKSLVDAYIEAKKGLENRDLLSLVSILREDIDVDQDQLEEVLKKDRQYARAERRESESPASGREARGDGRSMEEINAIREAARKRLEDSRKR